MFLVVKSRLGTYLQHITQNNQMKIISYNLNGIRAALKKNLLHWVKAIDADIICFQEIKATFKDIPTSLFEALGYHIYIYPAQKLGYSGVAILTKHVPKNIIFGCGIDDYDNEGRILRIDFAENTINNPVPFSVMSVYVPSGASSPERQAFKIQFLKDFQPYIKQILEEQQHLVICGDFNVCHNAIDIHNPKANAKNPGFLPEERSWLTDFLDLGLVDTFRHFSAEPHNYTWWSYRAGSRGKNLGWRIDYQFASQNLANYLTRSHILSEAKHSDHCPTFLEIDFV